VAVPLFESVSEPNIVPDPFRISTVPVGVPVAGLTAATVMLNVTDCPNTGDVVDGVMVVIEFAVWTTVRLRGDEVSVAKLASPA
jgi:hypothetical protein